MVEQCYATKRATKSPAMAASQCLSGGDRKPWWLSNRKIVDKYIREARSLIASQEEGDIGYALSLLDSALSLSPRYEVALELKARTLLHLRRFKDVADMLQDYIPSINLDNEENNSSSGSSDAFSQQMSKERTKLLGRGSGECATGNPIFKCFTVCDLKKKMMAGLFKDCDEDGQWRYLILGQACCHLGLMEDAMVLLQTGKRLSTAAFRRQSISMSDDSFSFSEFTDINAAAADCSSPPRNPPSEAESVTSLISHIKLLMRRRAAAVAALEAGLHTEAIRHFTKIVESRRGAPQRFLAECYLHRAFSYRSAGRIAESIADCNKALALEPTCIPALEMRASLLEAIRCLPDSLHDLEHLKLLYNSILRDRKLPGPAWKRVDVRYREIPGKLCALATRMQELKRRVAAGETGGNADYYALMGLRRGCSRSELERAHRLLCLRHKPDKATSFMERCEFADDRDLDSIRDRAKMSSLLLYRLIQRGYSSLSSIVSEEEAAAQRKKANASLVHHHSDNQGPTSVVANSKSNQISVPAPNSRKKAAASKALLSGCPNPSVFQGVFCRDLAAVGSLLAQAGFNRPISVKCEALSC